MVPEKPRPSLAERVPAAAAIVCLVIGTVTLIGWIAGVDAFTTWVPGTPQMKPNAALALIGFGIALWLVRTHESSDEARAWSRLVSELIAIGAALTLAEFAFGRDLRIDHVITDLNGTASPGRPSVHATAGVLACALWLAVVDRRGPRWDAINGALGAIAGVIVLTMLIAYAYDVDYVYGRGRADGIPALTVIGLVAVWGGILCARPSSAWMRLLSSPGAGGHVLRRLLVAVIVVPVVIGYVMIIGDNAGLFATRVGAAYVAAGAIALLVGLLAHTSRELERADRERMALEARLVALADRDPLTDVYNRRRIDEELARLLGAAQRSQTRLAVLEVDLDRFKSINDTHGHAAGDALLVATAEILRAELRTSDAAGRPGGDEFLVLLPGSDEAPATVVAEKLIEAFREVEHPLPDGGSIGLRASIGIAISDAGPWIEPSDLLAAADRALYAAKQAGGDRYVLDGPLVNDPLLADR